MLGRTSEHLRDAVCEALLNEVRSGALRPGDRLPPERALALQFGVSRTVVREAINTLAARGLVESKVGRGTFICKPDLERSGMTWALMMLSLGSADDVREAATYVGAMVCSLAASRGTPEAIATLVVQFERFRRGQSSLTEVCRDLAACAGNPSYLGLMAPYISFWIHTDGPWKEQRPIVWQQAVEGIQRRNPYEAYRAFFPDEETLIPFMGEPVLVQAQENLS